MGDIQRYGDDYTNCFGMADRPVFHELKKGNYVKYKDHLKAIEDKDAEIARLVRENNKLTAMVDNGLGFKDMVNDIKYPSGD